MATVQNIKKNTVNDNTVSIIIPTFNRKHILMKIIDSYLSQSNLYEVIVVDDGSTDGTYEYLQERAKFSKIIPVRHARNRGLANSRNTGIDIAKGEYLMLGEDDVILSANHISTLVKCLAESNSDLIAGRILYLRGGETLEECLKRYTEHDRSLIDRWSGDLINYWIMSVNYSKKIEKDTVVPSLHALTLGRAKVYKKIRYDPTSEMREDTDFCIRAGKQGYKSIFCPHTICFHLPRDKRQGGQWKVGVLKRHFHTMEGNVKLINRHYAYFKTRGMKGNPYTFILLQMVNQVRLLYKYFRGL